jgi:hypothetical protein
MKNEGYGDYHYFIQVIKQILKLIQEPKENAILDGQLKNILKQTLRSMDLILPLDVSKAAQDKADKLGIGTLYQYHWKDQTKMEGKIGREVFLLEHFFPIGEQIRRLLDLANGMDDSQIDRLDDVIYREVLSKGKTVWITKDEDKELTRHDFRTNRPDPDHAYRFCKIELLGEKYHDIHGNIQL